MTDVCSLVGFHFRRLSFLEIPELVVCKSVAAILVLRPLTSPRAPLPTCSQEYQVILSSQTVILTLFMKFEELHRLRPGGGDF